MARLNLSDLRGACADQRALFQQHFGEGGEVTLAKVRKVAALFNWEWAARNLLSASALAEYQRVRASALTEYVRVTASAWAEYDRVTASAWAEYDRVIASARAEYDRVIAPARAEYARVTASAWFAGWKSDHKRA